MKLNMMLISVGTIVTPGYGPIVLSPQNTPTPLVSIARGSIHLNSLSYMYGMLARSSFLQHPSLASSSTTSPLAHDAAINFDAKLLQRTRELLDCRLLLNVLSMFGASSIF